MFNIEKEVAKFTDFIPFENDEDYENLSLEEKEEYDYQLKIYRDWRNVIQFAYKDGVRKEKIESIISALKIGSLSVEVIAQIFKESVEYVLKIKDENSL